ncbi:MAG: ABC transporter permease [Firmicutes bacterium]|nr:ABC transporter permease [Bacillota bacterium]
MNVFQNVYAYRELLKTNVKKDIRGKYKGSVLGILWSFINPLLQVVVYWIVFPYLMRGTMDNYLIYLITGIIPWNFFLVTMNAGTASIKVNIQIIKKVYFPREILIISQTVSGVINFFISCIIILAFCLGTGVGISIHLVVVPIIVFIEAVFLLGLTFITSAVNAYIQDLEYIVTFLTTLLMYGTPIIYSLDLFKGSKSILYTMIQINPMTTIVNSYRDAFLYHQWPNFYALGLVFLLALVILIFGYWVFKKLEKGFAEVM